MACGNLGHYCDACTTPNFDFWEVNLRVRDRKLRTSMLYFALRGGVLITVKSESMRNDLFRAFTLSERRFDVVSDAVKFDNDSSYYVQWLSAVVNFAKSLSASQWDALFGDSPAAEFAQIADSAFLRMPTLDEFERALNTGAYVGAPALRILSHVTRRPVRVCVV